MAAAAWSAEDWQRIEQAARGAYQSVARVRALLPAGPEPRDRYNITVPRTSTTGGAITASTDRIERPTQLSCDFTVRSDQLEDVALICQLARHAGQALGGAENKVIALGGKWLPTRPANEPLPVQQGVRVSMGTVLGGDTGEATYLFTEPTKVPDLLTGLTGAVARLNGAGHYGPYAVLMGPGAWAQLLADRQREKVGRLLGADVVAALVPHELDATKGSLIQLLSLGSGAFDIVQVEPVALGIAQLSGDAVTLRVSERFLVRVLDETAIAAIRVASASGASSGAVDPKKPAA